jgi:hypothetical protein
MEKFLVTDGNGDVFEIQFVNRSRATEFADRSQIFTRPFDRVAQIHTLNGEQIWKVT